MLDVEAFGEMLCFYTFDEFMEKRQYIHDEVNARVDKSHPKYNRFFMWCYRMYVESRPWIREYYRECIWNYINGYMDEITLMSVYIQYTESLNRRKKNDKQNLNAEILGDDGGVTFA